MTGAKRSLTPLACGAFCAFLLAPSLAQSQSGPPWPAGDEIGMANTLGPRPGSAARRISRNPRAKSYELSFVRSNTMPQSPFAVPLRENAKPTIGVPMSRHAFNTDEVVSGDPGQQGTQMDALGHFAVLPTSLGRQERVSVRRREILRRLHAAAGQAAAGLAVAEARHRQGAADRHHRGAARRQDSSRQGQADGGGRAGRPRRTSRRC